MSRASKRESHAGEEVVGAAEFKAKCLDLLEQVREKGKSVVVTKRGVPIARLVPLRAAGEPLRGSMRDAFEIVGDIVAVDWIDDWEAAR